MMVSDIEINMLPFTSFKDDMSYKSRAYIHKRNRCANSLRAILIPKCFQHGLVFSKRLLFTEKYFGAQTHMSLEKKSNDECKTPARIP